MSLWPFRYLVVEWSTMSAPISSGRWKIGVAKVLSTAKRSPRDAVRSPTARRSVRNIIGLVGRLAVDHPGRGGDGALDVLDVAHVDEGELEAVRLEDPRASAASSRRTRSRPRRCDRPALNSLRMASSAASPEPNAKPWVPPSSARDVALQRLAGRVLGAAVLVALVLAQAFLPIGRGLVDRGHHRPGERIGDLAGVDGAGGQGDSRSCSRMRVMGSP